MTHRKNHLFGRITRRLYSLVSHFSDFWTNFSIYFWNLFQNREKIWMNLIMENALERRIRWLIFTQVRKTDNTWLFERRLKIKYISIARIIFWNSFKMYGLLCIAIFRSATYSSILWTQKETNGIANITIPSEDYGIIRTRWYSSNGYCWRNWMWKIDPGWYTCNIDILTWKMKYFRYLNGVSILLIKMLIWVPVKLLHAASHGVLQQWQLPSVLLMKWMFS